MCVVMLYIMFLVLGSHEEAVDDERKPVVTTRMGMYSHNRLILNCFKVGGGGGGVGREHDEQYDVIRESKHNNNYYYSLTHHPPR